jgi:hypothetical protein
MSHQGHRDCEFLDVTVIMKLPSSSDQHVCIVLLQCYIMLTMIMAVAFVCEDAQGHQQNITSCVRIKKCCRSSTAMRCLLSNCTRSNTRCSSPPLSVLIRRPLCALMPQMSIASRTACESVGDGTPSKPWNCISKHDKIMN